MAAQASNVKVFFRLMTTQTFDTDYINSTSATTTADPQVTYPSTGKPQQPAEPAAGNRWRHSPSINGCSLPFFATENFNSGPTDYNSGGVNNQNIEIPTGQDYAWAFYGCFLNVNDASNNIWHPAPARPAIAGRQRPQLPGGADRLQPGADRQLQRSHRESGESPTNWRSAISR